MAVTYVTLYLPGSSTGIQAVEGGQYHQVLVSMGANTVPSASGVSVRQDPYPQYVDDDELAAALADVGGGAVDSVNGQTGIVVLDADDIADSSTRKLMTSDERDKLAGVAPGANVYTDEQVRDLIGSTLVAGTGVTKTVDDAGNTVTLTAAGGGGTIETAAPMSMLTVPKDPVTGFWPSGWVNDQPIYTGGSASAGVRPTARGDLRFYWDGPDPSPAIVTSGTGGMRDGLDKRLVTP